MPIVSLEKFANHTAAYVCGDELTLVTRDGVPAIAITPLMTKKKEPLGGEMTLEKKRALEEKVELEVTMRELSRDTHRAVRKVEDKLEGVITYRGEVAAMAEKVDQDAFAACMLAIAPQFVRSMRRADEDFEAGRDSPLGDFIDQLER